MEHLEEILKVWADLHNTPSKLPKQRQLLNDLATILPRYGGSPYIQKMNVVRAGGSLEQKVIEAESLSRVAKKKSVESVPAITGFTEEKKTVSESQPSNDDQEVAAEGKRGRKPKVKE